MPSEFPGFNCCSRAEGGGSLRYLIASLRMVGTSATKRSLNGALPSSSLSNLTVRYSFQGDSRGNGIEAFKMASRLGFEGVVGKNLASKYSERRSTEWLKVKVHQQDEFVIGGFTEPTGSRSHFGALLLGTYANKAFLYAGKVGTGFDEKTLRSLYGKFRRLVRPTSPFASEVTERNVTFLDPQLVAQISYSEWTADGKLRHPVFLGLRDDKKAEEVRRDN